MKVSRSSPVFLAITPPKGKKKMRYIFGAGGHAREIREIWSRTISEREDVRDGLDIVLVDRKNSKGPSGLDAEVLSESNVFDRGIRANDEVVIGLGEPLARKSVFAKLQESGFAPIFPNIVDPSVVVLDQASLRPNSGLVIFPQAFISVNSHLGPHCHVNVGASISHDAELGEFSTMAPGARLLGNSHLGQESYLGAGATILPGVSVTRNVIIGAGGVVTKPIQSPGTYVGVPARKSS